MSIRMNRSFHGGSSLPARQEDSRLEILSRSDMYFYFYYYITLLLLYYYEIHRNS